jgi:hypothetical protein
MCAVRKQVRHVGRTRIFLAMPAMTKIEAVEAAPNLKFDGATQTRTKIIGHRTLFQGLQADTPNVQAQQRASARPLQDLVRLLRGPQNAQVQPIKR